MDQIEPWGPNPAGCVADAMRRNFVTVGADETLLEALRIMRLARLRHLLVERGGVLVGLLSYRSLQDQALERADAGETQLLSALASESVDRAMAESPYAVSPSDPLRTAAERLCRLQVGCLPVVEQDDAGPRLVGLITEVDLLRVSYGL